MLIIRSFVTPVVVAGAAAAAIAAPAAVVVAPAPAGAGHPVVLADDGSVHGNGGDGWDCVRGWGNF